MGEMGTHSQATQRNMPILPSRPCRRLVIFTFLWTCLCLVFFKVYYHHHEGSEFNNVLNTRELLQQEMVTKSSARDSTSFLPPLQANLEELMIDRSPKRSDKEILADLEKQLPNLPLVYLLDKKGFHYKNKTCAKFPTIYDININNIYWQETDTSNGTFYLYGAYLDIRKNNRLGPTVRILGMINRLEPQVKTHCQLWFNGTREPIISKVLEYKYIWYRKWGNYKPGIFQPYMLACQLPKTHWNQVPLSVSIVENVCDKATNNLRVIYNKLPEGQKAKKEFAVCAKGLDFPTDDLSVRLIEWIELLHVLGADKIFLYNLEIHPNVTKVLNYYEDKGYVDLTPISLPGYQPNIQVLQHLYLKSKTNNKRQNELIPYNDCLYRNMYRYEYIALLDIDEVIMPLKHTNWEDMMKEAVQSSLKVKNETRASWNYRNVYFMDEMLDAHEHQHFKDIPEYLHMMQHVYRSANYTKPGQYVKCFHNPEKALILHNHFPLGCLGGVCTSYPVDTGLAHLQHYRRDCVNTLKKSCANDFKSNSVKDTSIWKVKDIVISRTNEALQKLGFFGASSDRSQLGTNSAIP